MSRKPLVPLYTGHIGIEKFLEERSDLCEAWPKIKVLTVICIAGDPLGLRK
jgi:hypothetical protein